MNLEFEVDGVHYEVRRPTYEQNKEAQRVYNKAFNDAVQSKAILREKLNDFLREQGLWDDKKEAELTALQKELRANQIILSKGGIKKSQAREICIRQIEIRDQLKDLLSISSDLDSNTCQGQASSARLNYLVSACIYNKDTGKQVYKSIEDYLNGPNDEVSNKGATKFIEMWSGVDEDYENSTTEYKVLKQLGYMNDKNQLVDNEGNLVDKKGRRIDDLGRLINNEGKLIDSDGNLIDEDGNYIVEFSPFLDDEGNPIV